MAGRAKERTSATASTVGPSCGTRSSSSRRGSGREAFFAEHLAHGSCAQLDSLLAQRGADLVDGVVALAQLDDALARGGLLRLGARSGPGGGKEIAEPRVAEIVAEDAKAAGAVAELAGDLMGGAALYEVGAQGLVLALAGARGL
ncbi:MAG: hypothetical protein ACREU8_11755 [Gammaproteobacteria bacterium]